MDYIHLSKQLFEKFVEYNEDNPSGLIWKTKVVKMKANTTVGTVNRDNYWQFRLNGIIYKNHRVIACLFEYDVNSHEVDHIDGNRSNNKISNLRCVTPSDNQKNKKKHKNNTSGTLGVTQMQIHQKSGKVDSYWQAQWVDAEGKHHSKSFNMEKYGELTAKELAILYRTEKIKEAQKDLQLRGFFGYTDRHLNNIE